MFMHTCCISLIVFRSSFHLPHESCSAVWKKGRVYEAGSQYLQHVVSAAVSFRRIVLTMFTSAPQTSYHTVNMVPEVHSNGQQTSAWSMVAVGSVCFCMGAAFLAALQSGASTTLLTVTSPQVAAQTSVVAPVATAVQGAPVAYLPRASSNLPTSGPAGVGAVAVDSTFTTTTSAAGAPLKLASLLLLPFAMVAVVLGLKKSQPVAMAAVSGTPVASAPLPSYTDIEFPPLKNERMLRAARGEAVDRIPIWVMRQAGRYLPEYREFMSDKEFFTVCKDPKQVAEITLQPILRYDLDASIIFSDILVIPQAMGMAVSLQPTVGPVFEEPVRDKATWNKMQDRLLGELGLTVTPEMTSAEKNALLVANADKLVSPSLDYVYDAITETRTQLDGRVPLIGFCGAPMTLAVYMIEGQGSRTFTHTAQLFLGDPETAHEMLTVLTHMCAHYLMNQVRAGAQALQAFDSYAGALSPEVWMEFSYPYMKLIADMVKKEFPELPTICFAKDAHYALDVLSETKYDIIALDSSLDLGACHEKMTSKGKGVQGNLDPTVLYAPPEKITELVADKLQKAFGDGSKIPTKYIANMGHGMSPDHDPEHLRAFIDAIHAFGQ
jgi:uroporphyrinogen decarboxylase